MSHLAFYPQLGDPVLVGRFHSQLFIADQRLALHVVQMRYVFEQACPANWGHLQAQLSNANWQALLAHYQQAETPLPSPDSPFQAADVWGYEEGDFPDFLPQTVDDWLDPAFCRQHAIRVNTILNGDYWEFSSRELAPVSQGLKLLGYQVCHNDALAEASMGYFEALYQPEWALMLASIKALV